MPGGAAGQFISFHQHHIPAPHLSQVIGNAAPDNAPADDHHLGMSGNIHRSFFMLRSFFQAPETAGYIFIALFLHSWYLLSPLNRHIKHENDTLHRSLA
jgi:hypothetical protein